VTRRKQPVRRKRPRKKKQQGIQEKHLYFIILILALFILLLLGVIYHLNRKYQRQEAYLQAIWPGKAQAHSAPGEPAAQQARRPKEQTLPAAREQTPDRNTTAAPPRPPAGGPRMCVVIDDCGGNLQLLKELLALDVAVTPSVLPHLPYSRDSVDYARTRGCDPLLHLPMQPKHFSLDHPGYLNPGKGAILVGMTASQIYGIIERDLASVGPVTGVNNHMGSLVSEDRDTMARVLQAIKSNNLFFLDSRTTPKTVIPEIARDIGLPYLERDMFLDNSNSQAAILDNLYKLARLAQKQGYAIGIGHLKPGTVKALSAFSRSPWRSKVRMVSLSTLIRQVYQRDAGR